MTLLVGDCLKTLKTLKDNSVDSVVTDPPYEIGFMGKSWDGSGIAYNVELWRECLRVLKPGGHVLAFGATRSYHRMAVAIEDAGFEIRDSIHWSYGSGFPKSLNVALAIDKAAGAIGDRGTAINVSGKGTRADIETSVSATNGKLQEGYKNAKTTEAKQWEGWGTALKPSHEPVVVARKPLTGTVAGNVLEFGTGALNIDASRIGSMDNLNGGAYAKNSTKVPADASAFVTGVTGEEFKQPAGRWPANTVFTHAVDCVQVGIATESIDVPQPSLHLKANKSGHALGAGTGRDDSRYTVSTTVNTYQCTPGCPVPVLDAQADQGASRFFKQTEWTVQDFPPFIYIPKPSKRERNAGCDALPVKTAGEVTNRTEGSDGLNSPRAGAGRTSGNANVHPTVKPVTLMEYLITLVTPPGGLVLDPFLGSGTTAVAATNLGFKWVGCELTKEYVPIIKARVKHAKTLRAAALAKVEPDTLF